MADLTDELRHGLARQLTGNALYQEIVEKLENDALNKFRSSAPTDSAQREEAYHDVQAVMRLKRAVENHSKERVKKE